MESWLLRFRWRRFMRGSIKVECYAGYKAEERPLRFRLGEGVLEVEEVEDQWYGPSAHYFRVRTSDGNVYVLCHDEETDCWSLSAFRKAQFR
jgi:hypothetical protein